jgi:hypothetical protein
MFLRPRRAPRHRPALSVESLEERDLPSGITFQYVLADPNHEFAAFPLLRQDLQAAGQILSGLLDGQGTLQVLVRANDGIPRSDGSTVGVAFAGTDGSGRSVYRSAALAEVLTGVNPNGGGPVIELDFNARDYLPHVWFDPSGAARTGAVPAGKTDFISVALHETLHALGFQGYRAIDGPAYGTLPADHESDFDALTAFGAGGSPGTLYFQGSQASALYGGPVPLTSVGPSDPLTSQNFYHVGNPAGGPGSELLGDIMNGMEFTNGTRYTVSPLDLAILADLGWSVHGMTPPPAQPVIVPAAPPAPPAHHKHHVHRPAHRPRHTPPKQSHRPAAPLVDRRIGLPVRVRSR